MKYNLNGYTFDSNRLIVYKSKNNENTKRLIDSLDNNLISRFQLTRNELLSHNHNKMVNKKFAFDSCGIIPTYNCNLHCAYCAYNSGEIIKKENYNIDDVKAFLQYIIKRKAQQKFIDENSLPLYIDLTGGGEPTYNWKNFTEVVLFARQKCESHNVPYKLELTTNGVLSDTQLNFLAENFDKVMVSYDGLPEIQNRNRKTTLDKSTNKFVENSIIKLSNADIELKIRTTISQDDIPLLDDMYAWIESILPKNGKAIWSLYPIENEGRALEIIDDYSKDRLNKFIDFYLKTSEELFTKNKNSGIIKLDIPVFISNVCDIFCGATILTSAWLLPDGDIVTCINSPLAKVVIGNVKNTIVNFTEKYEDKLMQITKTKYDECVNCIAYAYCKGGCPIWHMRGAIDGIMPQECYLQQNYLKRIITNLIDKKFAFNWELESLENFSEEVYYLKNKDF